MNWLCDQLIFLKGALETSNHQTRRLTWLFVYFRFQSFFFTRSTSDGLFYNSATQWTLQVLKNHQTRTLLASHLGFSVAFSSTFSFYFLHAFKFLLGFYITTFPTGVFFFVLVKKAVFFITVTLHLCEII